MGKQGEQRITVKAATEAERPIMTILFQFYYYEFTKFKAWDVQEDGWFENHGLDGCWTTPERHPFLFRVDGNLAGFAIVDRRRSLAEAHDVWDMADFSFSGDIRSRVLAAKQPATSLIGFSLVGRFASWRKTPGRWRSGARLSISTRAASSGRFSGTTRNGAVQS